MTLSTSIDTPADVSRNNGDTYAWDWSATTHDVKGTTTTTDWLAAELVDTLGGSSLLPGKGLQGWAESVQVFDSGGFRLGNVYFGGDRTDVHVVATSSAANDVRPIVCAGLLKHRPKTSRVDTRVDTLLPFDELRSMCEGLGGRGTKIVFMESRTMTGGGESASTGRTIYVGAPTSAVRVRVYEKWLESPGMYEEGTNRVEVQLRPPSQAKQAVSSWGPAETFCASKLTRRLAAALETDVAHPGSLQKSKGTPDLEASLAAMGKQYGNAFRTWMEVSRGDLGTVLDHFDA